MSILEQVDVRTKGYETLIDNQRSYTIRATNVDATLLPFTSKHNGKVRDVYRTDDYIVMIATDRQSAFDRQLASVPFKGQVLNLTSKWWFEKTAHIVPNHTLAYPHPNVTIGKKCTVFPIEFVMRGYLTGSTSTSIWTNYAKGVRQYCGHLLPDNMVKNQKLDKSLLTPTTKDDLHDELISAEEIVSSGMMTLADWEACAKYAIDLFEFSQQVAAEKGLILVDTKYEFGRDDSGTIILIDEIQTPDSSRFWLSASYETRLREGKEPDNIDKEFLRKWFVERCDPYNDAILPEAPAELVNELSRRYIMIYEVLTGEQFKFPNEGETTDSDVSINAALAVFLQK